MRHNRTRTATVLLLAVLGRATAQDLVIPPVKTSVAVGDQPIAVTASGTISELPASGAQKAFALKLTADLSDLQAHITELLRAQLDRSDPCGERISVERATFAPAAPSGLLTARLYYERWACAKVFGRQMSKKLVAGNGVVPVTFTPVVEGQNTLRLASQVGDIQADGSLGELLRSGSFGTMVREKISRSVQGAIEKGAGLNAALPPAVRQSVAVKTAAFKDLGSGRLGLVIGGEVRLAADQVALLRGQLKR